MNAEIVREIIDQFQLGHRYPNMKRADSRALIPKHVRYGVFIRDGWRCILCGAYGDEAELHVDHISPWSSYGPDVSANLRTLCRDCNLKRSNYVYPEDGRKVLPVAAGCMDCEPDEDHDYGTLAYCVYCQTAGYSQMVDECWLDDCDCR